MCELIKIRTKLICNSNGYVLSTLKVCTLPRESSCIQLTLKFSELKFNRNVPRCVKGVIYIKIIVKRLCILIINSNYLIKILFFFSKFGYILPKPEVCTVASKSSCIYLSLKFSELKITP